MRRAARFPLLLILSALLLALSSCAEETFPSSLAAADGGGTGVDAGVSLEGDAGAKGISVCWQAHAESIPARLTTLSAHAESSGTVVLASDLYTQRFLPICGGCHGPALDQGMGGYQVARASEFAAKMTQKELNHVIEADCSPSPTPNLPTPMPLCGSPNGGTYARRPDTDPVKQFAKLVQQWIDLKNPAQFTIGGEDAGAAADGGGDAGSSNSFGMTPAAGNAMTNIGNCIPSPALIGTDAAKSAALDAKFANARALSNGTAQERIGLPEHLYETDLSTFDSAALARSGVIAYAPGYPLWSDDAAKLRHVRVPRGASIHFDKATQTFEIPLNTRFYKTFMKQVVDTDGSYRYRKIETRLIVSRPDMNAADGSASPTALFGSYQWNADETDATLVETPLRDGTPFADTIISYHTDEPLAADLLRGQPPDPDYTLVAAHAARHYAIPSSGRCIQCHMGSPSQSFVLGFTPLQINRFATGTHGTIPDHGHSTGPDELTQLQRLIDDGVITGIESPSDVLPLERSQGTRLPRNEQELVAQGYLLGNCAHCHNPRGFPTVQNPVLKDVLSFLPAAGPVGGIFQFPLEQYSPRIGRGITGTTKIPYITPSLVDLPKADANNQLLDWFVIGTLKTDIVSIDYAPWRSIIYRNVDAAFAYADDVALFPHMPMNTPGYDARAKQILGDWMVSIPAVRKRPDVVEYTYRFDNAADNNFGSSIVDMSEQPYVEVLPGSPGYTEAFNAAQRRLAIFHAGLNPEVSTSAPYSRYADPGQTEDIFDPEVLADTTCHPVPTGNAIVRPYPLPEHPHWVQTDLTIPAGKYSPRQATWPDVLVNQKIPSLPTGGCNIPSSRQAAYDDEVDAIKLVPNAKLADVSSYATKAQPFGLWEQQAGCTFPSDVPRASSFVGASRPHWMGVAAPQPSDPVYMQTPGASIFKMICINCHGPHADSNGRMAQNLATMSGGNALVANFRDGLFGPVDAPGQHIHEIFGTQPGSDLPSNPPSSWTQGLIDDDRAARYMAWMALGGTTVNIPVEILQIVAVTKVLDHQRTIDPSQLSANMLSEAKSLCRSLLGVNRATTKGSGFYFGDGKGYLTPDGRLNSQLLLSNGDAEMWLHLCSLSNPPPVHVLTVSDQDPINGFLPVESIVDPTLSTFRIQPGSLLDARVYPVGKPIGNDRGLKEARTDPTLPPADNQLPNDWPWCVDDTAATPAQIDKIGNLGLPTCPPEVLDVSRRCNSTPPPPGCVAEADANRWAVRGAINAGLSVFLYVQSLEKNGPAPDYNQCKLLK